MFGSGVLDMALGLVFFYFLLSTVCATINEWLAGVLNLRARTLEQAIRRLLGGSDLAGVFYQHPLIEGLGQEARPPSYISSSAFTTALIDTLTRGAGEAAAGEPEVDPVTRLRVVISGLSGGQKGRLHTTLLALLDSSGGDMQQARLAIARWFDEAMDRVSGWYKRSAQRNIFFIALLLTAAINGDTMAIARSLWREPLLRESLSASAREVTRSGQPVALHEAQQQIGQLHQPLGWSLAEVPPGCPHPRGAAWTHGQMAWWWLGKVLGLLLTAIAVSLGAPFWFDLLNRVGNLRHSGERPERAPLPGEITAAAGAPPPAQ